MSARNHLGLGHGIAARSIAVESRLAISSDASVDELVVEVSQGLVVKLVFLQAEGFHRATYH